MGADFVAAAGHKWLLGVWGGGFLYVDPDAYDRLRQTRIGYRSVENPGADGYVPRGRAPLRGGATSRVHYVSLANATRRRTSQSNNRPRVERLTDRAQGRPRRRLLSPRDYESGLVTFTADDPEATVERLAAKVSSSVTP